MALIKKVRDMLPLGVKLYSNDPRAQYLTENGQQAPPFIPELAVRLWSGNADDGFYPDYDYIDGTSSTLLHHAAIPASKGKANLLFEAFLGPQSRGKGVNIPGPYAYMSHDQWRATRASSSVTVKFKLFGVEREIDVDVPSLFTAGEAVAVASEIGQGAKAEEATDWNGQPATYSYPAGEKRRVWSIRIGSMLLALSWLFKQRTESPTGNTSKGVGSPGRWVVADGGAIFQSAGVDTGETRTDYVPVPSVPLGADEEVAIEAVGGMPVVGVRKKGSGGESGVLGAPTSGTLDPELARMIRETYAAVQLLTVIRQ